MDFEQTDQEQVEALRKWWQENWLALVSGLVIGLGGIVGWDYYRTWTAEKQITASNHFETVRELLELDQTNDAAGELAHLQQESPDSPYASQASLVMASAAAGKGNWSKAGEYLQWVVANGATKELKALARLRLARVRWAEGNPSAALALLDQGLPDPLAPVAAELRGDIQRQLGNHAAARAAYQQALLDDQGSIDRALLQRKIDDLPQSS